MGFGLRGSSHLSKCQVLCWYDGIPCTTCSNQSGFPQWWTREKLSSASTARTGCSERRSLCKGHCGPHPSTTNLLSHGPARHAGGWCEQRLSLGAWNMVPASVGRMTRTIPSSLSGLRMRICWKHLMMRPFCKAYDTPVQELVVSIHHWPWWKPTLLRRTVPLGCEGCTWSLWICTDAGEWLTGFWGYLPTSMSIVVQESVWTLSLSRGNRTRKLTSLDMCLDMQWKVVTSRATSFGPLGQRNNPSGALMPGKGIGWG